MGLRPRCALHRDINGGRVDDRGSGGELDADGGDAIREVVHRRRRGTQSLHGIAPLGDRRFRLIERLLQPVFRFLGTRRQQVHRRLESQ